MWANLGARVVERGQGRAVVVADLRSDAHGFPTSRGTIVHGGAIAALADMALAAAAASLADGQAVTTVDLKVDFLRLARPGRLVAKGEVRRRTHRLCFAAAGIEGAEGEVVAEARAVLAYVR